MHICTHEENRINEILLGDPHATSHESGRATSPPHLCFQPFVECLLKQVAGVHGLHADPHGGQGGHLAGETNRGVGSCGGRQGKTTEGKGSVEDGRRKQ